MRIGGLIWRLLAALSLTGCGSADDVPDYRYRLTVEVETPEGVRSGSSVIEVRQSLGRSAMDPSGKIIIRRVRGEAVMVDLPSGQTLFALLRSEYDADWAANVMQMLAPQRQGQAWEQQFDNMLALEGERVVPRRWPRLPGGDRPSAYPFLVTFSDLDNPASVELVDPDDLEPVFGDGITLRRITVQLTNDEVTDRIDRHLGWLREPLDDGLTVEDFPDGLPVGDYSGLFLKE